MEFVKSWFVKNSVDSIVSALILAHSRLVALYQAKLKEIGKIREEYDKAEKEMLRAERIGTKLEDLLK
jgi:hypothetical protein